ncbi:hypothetical protein [Arachidicoccus rhizosphaerae]|nr:hypothetical protein [Arachidicoccus rhizosphaerae]
MDKQNNKCHGNPSDKGKMSMPLHQIFLVDDGNGKIDFIAH